MILDRLNNCIIKNVDTSKEMDKIFNKLKRKYSSKDLEYKLRNKLYSAGYTKEEIDNYIKKSSC